MSHVSERLGERGRRNRERYAGNDAGHQGSSASHRESPVGDGMFERFAACRWSSSSYGYDLSTAV
jgi:hypothetical protein